MFRSILVFLILSFALSASGQKSNVGPLKRADVLSAKAMLENMIVQRYSQELSTLVLRDHFTIGARVEIVSTELGKGQRKPAKSYTDLDLGYLDADVMFDKYMSLDQPSNPLEKFSVRSIDIQVGLRPNMGEEAKKNVETWLNTRVSAEFGRIGKAQVNFIQNPPLAPKTPERQLTMMEQLKELQGLAGHLILAVAILLGVLLYKFMSGAGGKKEAGAPISISNKMEGGGAGAGEGDPAGAVAAGVIDVDNDPSLLGKIDNLSAQIKDLAPKMVGEIRNVVKEWCEQGEEGLYQLACFAEISGSVLGSLPIPAEYKKKMGDVFASMHEMGTERKFNIVNRTYWDLVASLNLGTDSLHRPFSFVGKAPVGTVSKVLLGNDLDIQTIVSLYMPESMRRSYFSGLENDKKIELLNTAAKLTTISQENLSQIEEQIAPYFGEQVDENQVSLSLTLQKLIDTMDLVEACKVLPKVEGPVIEQFKMTNPHIAFFEQWSPGPMELVAKKATNEELISYCRVVPDMADLLVELVSPRTKKILSDDLSRPDRMMDSEKEAYISSLHDKLIKTVNKGEVSLDEAVQSFMYTSDGDEDFAA